MPVMRGFLNGFGITGQQAAMNNAIDSRIHIHLRMFFAYTVCYAGVAAPAKAAL